MITLIAAVAKNGVIGFENTIPWHLPEDFKHFSATTREHVVIMGANTWNSLPERFKPLPRRWNMILSKHPDWSVAGVTWSTNLDAMLALAKIGIETRNRAGSPSEHHLGEEIFIIGGASLYRQTIDIADRLLISEIDMKPQGDTFFPNINEDWFVHHRDKREQFTIVDYRRAKNRA